MDALGFPIFTEDGREILPIDIHNAACSWGPTKNMKRREDIVMRRLAGETWAAIGKDYDVSRERVRQIYVKVMKLAARENVLIIHRSRT